MPEVADSKPAAIRVALTIAGSDSGGGAGIQADLKTFVALGIYGTTAITAVTVQNTLGVSAVHAVPAAIVAAQIDAILTDIGADAAKIGMLVNSEIIEAVAAQAQLHRLRNLVIDPVLVAKGGHLLLEEKAIAVLKAQLFPVAMIITPNLPEAEALAGRAIDGIDAISEAAKILYDLGPRYVLIKGGHLAGEPVDTLYDGVEFRFFRAPRIDTPHTHGTGCTLSAAIAAHLARGASVPEATALAKDFITAAIRHSLALGYGHGPVNQFFDQSNNGDGSLRRPGGR